MKKFLNKVRQFNTVLKNDREQLVEMLSNEVIEFQKYMTDALVMMVPAAVDTAAGVCTIIEAWATWDEKTDKLAETAGRAGAERLSAIEKFIGERMDAYEEGKEADEKDAE